MREARGTVLTLLVAALAAGCGSQAELSAAPESSLPAADVRVVTDGLGIAHVYAKSDADALYGSGWAMAREPPHDERERRGSRNPRSRAVSARSMRVTRQSGTAGTPDGRGPIRAQRVDNGVRLLDTGEPMTFRSILASVPLAAIVALGCSSGSTDTAAATPDASSGCGETCDACGAGTYASPGGACGPFEGTPRSHDFPTQTVHPGEEQLGKCRSWTLGNDQELWVNGVELTQSEDSHHSNFVFVPDDHYAGPDGIWGCSERAYDFYGAVAAGGVLFAQATQATYGTMHFQSGAAIRLPPHARIVSDIHLLNASTAPVTGHATLTLYEVLPAAAKVKLEAFHIEYDALAIPPHSTARFTGTCPIAPIYEQATKTPFAPKIYYFMPHTHTMGTRLFAKTLGGAHDGEMLFDATAGNGELRGQTFDPPLDLSGASGFVFGCEYANPSAGTIGWGFGGKEMCELFGFADASSFFQARVTVGKADGTSGAMQLFAGTCDAPVVDP